MRNFTCLFALIVFGHAHGQFPTILEKDSLIVDFKLFRAVVEDLHPGLYRYEDRYSVLSDFEGSEAGFIKSRNIKEAFLSLHRATSKIQCGHTYPNYWNQESAIRSELFEKADKLPFTLKLLPNSIRIHKDLSGNAVKPSATILNVNNIPVGTILDSLQNYRRIDGSNLAKFYEDFSVKGEGKYEAFDIIFPMLFPPVNGFYTLDITENGYARSIKVAPITRAERKEMLQQKYGNIAVSPSELWSTGFWQDSIARLNLKTFAVWNMDMDWRAYLKAFFKKAKDKGSTTLVLDLRGNEGGLMEVYWELFAYLTPKPLRLERDEQLVRYQSVKEAYRPYLETWDNTYFDRGSTVKLKSLDFFEFSDPSLRYLNISPSEYAFEGKIMVLIDAANSSATYYLAKYLKENQLATLVGASTGGNVKGTNGGEFFMLKLPYTKLEVDIPLVGYYPRQSSSQDGGLQPDIQVDRNADYYFYRWNMDSDPDFSKVLEYLVEQ
ncbi:MAG: S41 family peptidase [Bacteroidota bacterium]